MNGRALRAAAALVAVLVAALLAVRGAPTTSGALSTALINSTNTAASAVFGTCVSAANSIGAYFVWPFDEASGAAARDTSPNNRPGSYVSGGLLGGSITYSAAGPCPRDGARAVTLNTALLNGVVSGPYVTTSSAAAVPGPQTFSAGLWFRTTSTTGGKLIGFGNARTGASTSFDRHIYMATDGTLYAGVYPNPVKTVSTSAKLNDGVWHFAMMTLGPGGLSLYVDGAPAITNTTATSAESSSGFWRVGYDALNTGWPAAPVNTYFNGSVAFAQVYSSALTPTQVATLYASGR